MKNLFCLIFGLSPLAVSQVNAAVISYSERPVDQAIDTADYRASWYAQTSAITTRSLSDFDGTKLTNG